MYTEIPITEAPKSAERYSLYYIDAQSAYHVLILRNQEQLGKLVCYGSYDCGVAFAE